MARPADPRAKSALVAAARKEFVRSGIQKARIEDITQACGLSKGAFYLHFDSKEALFRGVVSELQVEFEHLRVERQSAYEALTARGVPPRNRADRFIAALTEIDRREDRKLLELLWRWRDVTDVLLHGSQGTEFQDVMWTMLDHEVARVELECGALKDAGLLRGDVPGELLGLMIVGTYLLVARRLATLDTAPDFEHWVIALQTLITEGVGRQTFRRSTSSSASKTTTSPHRARRSASPRRREKS